MVLQAGPAVVRGQGSDAARWQQYQQSADSTWQEQHQAAEARFEQFEREQAQHWQGFKAEVAQKWETFVDSTQKRWVDYGAALDVRSVVDFEKGVVEVTAIVPRQATDVKHKGIGKITSQVARLFSSDNPAKAELLRSQVKNRKGEIVTARTVQDFIQQEVVPAAHVAAKPYQAKDGVARVKVSARVHLVPDHLRIRAQKYLPAVNQQARRFNIAPQLVLAVIHTESYFNPLAKSACGALGLMQLMPRFGAREAYWFVHKQDKVLPSAYLYNPDNNIELGSAYLHLLKNSYFQQVDDAYKRRCLVVCAYNWGPAAIKKKIMQRYAVDTMSRGSLYAVLRDKTPLETRDYLQRVFERIPIYDNFY